MRATWVTDIHLNFLRPHGLAQFYAALKAEAPDALFVTGDIAEADSVVRFLTELVAETDAHVYFVLGNHDYYRSNIRVVRDEVQRASPRATWLPGVEAMRISDEVVMIGVDGWGDARCGDLASKVQLSDWHRIEDFRRYKDDVTGRIELLQRLGNNEARSLKERLARAPVAPELLVLT
ncbi:MAG: metallophosphoesterase, partial [Kofleriaceae bacterium]